MGFTDIIMPFPNALCSTDCPGEYEAGSVFAAGFAALLNSRLGLVSAKGEKKPSEPKASSPSRYLRSPKERF
jgi:hypothetical protein